VAESFENFGTCTNRGKIDKKIDEIRLLKKRATIIEKAVILFNSGKFAETIDYLISIEALPREQEQFF
jgi:hypothetical protein